jgi:CubicO group peptidase (beta-lactamase class C family)
MRNACSAAVYLAASVAVAACVRGAEWERRAPDQAGLDEKALDALAHLAGGRGCVVRHGCLVYTWGDAAKRGDVASACKPWFTHFLLKAMEDGRIANLDEKVAKYEPRLAALNAALGHKDAEITWRHMANQVSCYGVAEKPGAAFCYNDWQMALFWDLLFTKVYGASYDTVDETVLRPLLADPLQCQDKPTLMAFGTKERPGRVAVSPRDFARFGLLYLRQGNWRGKQLLKAEYVKLATTSPLPAELPQSLGKAAEMLAQQRTLGSDKVPDNQCGHVGSYSFLWWTNGVDRAGRRHWPAAPVETYGVFGHGGIRAMVVLPPLDLIVSWNDTQIRGADKENEALRLVVGAVKGK